MSAKFATTQWSQVLAVYGGSTQQSRDALEQLCEAYWYPLYAYVRRQGYDPDQARDLTQAFFGHLLESDLIQVADPDRGKFRSFLLTSLKNFLSHERDKAGALKRGGGAQTVSLDVDDAETRFHREPADELTPDVLFERRWAMTLMERAMSRLAVESQQSGHPERFDHLKLYLTGSEPHIPYKEVAQTLDMSDSAVRVAIHRMRKRYGELLREEIADTVADPDQLDEELRHLLTVLSDSG
jgi:RNA polymerase sigma-70 factor (ECF subfamily)